MSERFSLSKDGKAILDEVTGKKWIVGPDHGMTFFEVLEFEKEHSRSWRLPSYEEVQVLYKAGISADSWGPFQNSGTAVWTDDEDMTYDNYPIIFDFSHGFGMGLYGAYTGENPHIRIFLISKR